MHLFRQRRPRRLTCAYRPLLGRRTGQLSYGWETGFSYISAYHYSLCTFYNVYTRELVLPITKDWLIMKVSHSGSVAAIGAPTDKLMRQLLINRSY